jgi:hypothetical protein
LTSRRDDGRKTAQGGVLVTNAKIVLVGVGSADFGLDTLAGLFSEREALQGATLSLVDIDEPSLETSVARTPTSASLSPSRRHPIVCKLCPVRTSWSSRLRKTDTPRGRRTGTSQ